MRLYWAVFSLLALTLTDVGHTADVAKEELDRLHEYINSVRYLEEEDELNNVAKIAGDTISAEESAMRSACDTEMQVTLPLPDDIDSFHKDVVEFAELWNECLGKWNSKSAYATWQYETDLTDENQQKLENTDIQTSALQNSLSLKAQKVMEHNNYNHIDNDLQRQIRLLASNKKPKNPKDSKDLISVQAELQKIYSTAKVNSLALEPNLTTIMAESRDPEVLLGAWWGWRAETGPAMKDKYAEMVRLLNIGATDNGYTDYAQAWIESQFDSTDNLTDMAEQLWLEVKPLYQQLHAYVRLRLELAYIDYSPSNDGFEFWDIFSSGGIPAHLLGNMWAQEWGNVYELVKPFPGVEETDYDAAILEQNYDVNKLFTLAEEFYTSIGLFKMTDTFNDFSMKTRPADREVVCHAAAFDFFTVKPVRDFRIKMCTEIKMDSFETIHHEMGHIEYFMAYQDQPTIYRDGANSGFHEAIGDTISMSVMTREHLKTVGIDTDKTSPASTKKISHGDINFLMKRALFKVAFLPFGYMIDKWRWDVFRGKVKKADYNKHWWDLRLEYQGLVSPVTRSEDDFDPGAKFHIPANSPYICYFISFIIQFQFYEAMCKTAGHEGPLHTCDFYNSKEAGAKLKEMLTLGKSKPWPEAMNVLTGTTKIDTSAILNYFEPLRKWLEDENKRLRNPVGWEDAEINWRK